MPPTSDPAAPHVPLSTGASLGETAFAKVLDVLRAHGPRVFVEFGSGRSTARFATEFPEASLLSLDHDPFYAGETRDFLARTPATAHVDLQLRPLRWQRWYGLPFRSYAPGAFPERIDTVLVDGPPVLGNHRGREACLYQIWDHLDVGALIVLDDCKRPQERQIVANWMQRFPGAFRVDYLDTPKGTALLHKIAHPLPTHTLPATVDAMGALVSSAIIQAKVAVHRRIYGPPAHQADPAK